MPLVPPKRSALFVAFLAAAPVLAQQQTSNPQLSEQVSVTTTRSTAGSTESGRTSYELDSRKLQQYPAITLDEALRQHAGFELFRRSSSRVQNPTSQGISLRGLGSTAASRTLVLEEGVPLNDAFGGWIHWNENPEGTVDRVSLVTGGGSDLYGSSALGGVIDVVPRAPDKTSLDLSAFGGSQFTEDLAGVGSLHKPFLEGLLAAEVLRTAGYIQVSPDLAGPVDVASNLHSEAVRTELAKRLPAASRLSLTGNMLNEARSNGTPFQTNATRLWRYVGGYTTPDDRRLTARAHAFGSDEGYRQSFSAIAPNRASEALTRLQHVKSQEFGATGDTTLRLGKFAGVAGADLRDIRATDDERPISGGLPNGDQNTTARQRFTGGFVEALGTAGKWSGAASLRVDAASDLSVIQTTAARLGTPSVTNPADRTEIVASPRLGIIRTLGSSVSLHANGFRAFRAPTMNELYRTGQVGQETTRANAGLLSERATGWEIGAQALHLPAQSLFSATYFWTEINRPVSAVLVSQTATTITNIRENLGQIRSQGVETQLDLRQGRAVSASVGYQYANAVVTRFSAQPSLIGKRIPNVERHSATAQLRAAKQTLGELTLAARFGGKAFDDSSNIYPLSHFFELDLSGQHSFGSKLDCFFILQNLTDQRQQVSRTPVLTLGSPILAEAGLRLRLGHATAHVGP